MTKLLIEEIRHCFACPHHYRETWKTEAKWMCDKAEYKEIDPREVDTNSKFFPDWCPLPDYPAKEEGKDG